MFADDVALLADTVVGLQRQLNLLYDFCTDFYLTVNIIKTKDVVFKNGGCLATNEKWYYNGNFFPVEQTFTYRPCRSLIWLKQIVLKVNGQ